MFSILYPLGTIQMSKRVEYLQQYILQLGYDSKVILIRFT